MRKSRIDWVKIKEECVLFDLSEYCPELRQDPAVHQRISENDLEDTDDWCMID